MPEPGELREQSGDKAEQQAGAALVDEAPADHEERHPQHTGMARAR